MPGLAPRMDVLSWEPRDFQISFSNRDTSRNAWNRHWGSFMVDTGILSNNMFYGRYGDLIKQISLTQMLNDILWPDHIQWQPYTDKTLYRTRPFTEFWVVSIEHFRRVRHVDRGRLPLRTPGPVTLGLAYVLLFRTCRCFTGLCYSNIPLYFLDFAFNISERETSYCLIRSPFRP